MHTNRQARSSEHGDFAPKDASKDTPENPSRWQARFRALTPLKQRFLLAFIAILAGGLQFLSYAPLSWWWTAWVGLALLIFAFFCAADWKSSVVGGFSWATATALFSLPWIGSFVGIGPYVALSIVLGLLTIPAALAMWLIAQSSFPLALKLPGMAAALVAGEALLARWPFGGFPWLRVAWGQVDGPLAPAVAIGSTALVTFLAACVGAGLVALTLRSYATSAALLVGALIVGWALPAWTQPLPEPTAADNARVAVIQGNVPRLGLEFNAQRRAVLQNHADATNELARRVHQGKEQQPDIVIWPENSSDVSPFTDGEAARIIENAAMNIGAPIVVGTFTYTNGVQNTMVVWDPKTGPGDQHEKIYLQPFGETMPFRELLRHFSDMVDHAGDMTPGNGDAVVTTPGTDGLKKVNLGLATCYEVVFDGAFRNAVNHGSTMLATPTNNATFGFTDMTYQQLAMSRMRAMEFQRSTAVAATSGVSAIVDAHGDVVKQSKIFEQKVLTETLPQYSHLTFAARFGTWIEGLLTAFGILCVVGAVLRRRGGDARAGADEVDGRDTEQNMH